MEHSYAFKVVSDFLAYAGKHGLINASTTRSYKVGCSKIEGILTPDELADVRKIDADAVYTRFANATKLKISPRTLREYRRRLAASIYEFLEWRDDPSAYKPKGSGKSTSKGNSGRASQPTNGTKRERERAEREAASRATQDRMVASAQASAPLLSLPYPLRSDLLAHVQVPRDMTTEEASRLAAFIKTLATDFEPSD